MFEYVDLYMQQKPRWNRAVVLNIYGGESLFHPNIVEILQNVRSKYQTYKDRWPLTVTCTTNGVVGPNLMNQVVDLIDEFTVSYHAESLAKQKKQVIENLKRIKQRGRRLKCVVLMHGDPDKWPELLELIDFCRDNDIKYLPRQLDGDVNSNYTPVQIKWFQDLWNQRSATKAVSKQKNLLKHKEEELQSDTYLSKVGRACCGGRLMCTNSELKDPVFYIPDNNFLGWHCSVNWFFLYIKQHTRQIFTNKDCRMDFQGRVAPIGHLDRYQELLDTTRSQLESKQMPVIQCAKNLCTCGLCAPKAQDIATFIDVIKKHVVDINVFRTVDDLPKSL